jgi:hypothetical protein
MSERFVLAREGCDLAGERWPGGAPLLVLLHEGVSDRRGWRQVAERLSPAGERGGLRPTRVWGIASKYRAFHPCR